MDAPDKLFWICIAITAAILTLIYAMGASV